MTNLSPITPTPELVREWARFQNHENPEALWRRIATLAARWGADQELKACCDWVEGSISTPEAAELRAARRPKPPSLKERALKTVDKMSDCMSAGFVPNSCFLELRARIEALEACDKEDANCWQSVRASIHKLRARIEALEAAQQPHQDKMDRLIAIDRDDPANITPEHSARDMKDDLHARCGTPTAQPVPVSERLPGPEDCDSEGMCWWWDEDDDMWRLRSEHRHWLLCWTHWLPHWALPVPTPANTISQEDYE